jgi:DHA1 family bicyclomycin/chloramphenicol resistance-like MFS transporter
MATKNKFYLLLTLGLLTAIGPFSIDMYLPGFPNIAESLQTNVAKVSLSLSSFFIGISFGQLLYGPLLDRFGRKGPMYIGLTAYVLASIGCAFANSVELLIVWRLLQALGGCVGMVASRAMVRDLFPVNENAKIFSTLMLVVGVSPIIAPTLGGYVTAHLGWRYVFGVLTLMGGFILAMVHFQLPESKQPDPDFSLKPKAITIGFWEVMKDPQFYTYALTGAVAAAGLYAYIAGSPYVFMEIYGVTEREYGWIFALVAAGLILATQINTVLLKRYTSQQIIPVALIFQSLAGIALVTGAAMGWLNAYIAVPLLFCFLSCQGFTFPNSSALSMAPFSKNAGTASALMGGIQMGVGAAISALVSFLSNHTALPMTGMMAFCAISALGILAGGRKIIRKKTLLADINGSSLDIVETT